MRPQHQSHWRVAFGVVCLLLLGACASISTTPVATWQSRTLNPNADTGADFPPAAPREFRAAWVSTVANIDWPSRKDLNVSQQRAEIIAMVNRAKELNMNALILQVRPSADAIYPSAIEPWSEFLTGEQGRAPSPFYDPLRLWIDEAHERGIELHAWFNPYRARHIAAKSPLARNHIGVTNPGVVKSYGGYLWMDPGDAAAAKQTLDVVLDVVRRYDIDGVHIDDYFYPYPVPAAGSTSTTSTTATPPAEQDFPDDDAWQAFVKSGGKLNRADWRRQSVNELIERMHDGVHREKQWVKFGISPFGLGKPDRRPAGIVGFSQYDKLYADVELWLNKGWLDYLAPQLYWPIDQAPQAFGVLLDYWIRENKQSRHVWSGLYTSRINSTDKSWQPQEIVNQIKLTRSRAQTIPAASGHIHFSMVALMQNRKGIGDELKTQSYLTPALIPATPWLENVAPPAPQIALDALEQRKNVRVKITPGNVTGNVNKPAHTATKFAIWAKYADNKNSAKSAQWQFSVVPAVVKNAAIETELLSTTHAGSLSAVVVSAISRTGIESARTIVQPTK